MAFNLEHGLCDLGVLDKNGSQIRPVCRLDLLEVLRRLDALSAQRFRLGRVCFANLDFRGIDLRGLDLRRTRYWRFSFEGCDFSKAVAYPMVEIEGIELSYGDLATEPTIALWKRGSEHQLKELEATVTPTKLDGSWMEGAILDGADFRYAEFRKTNLWNCRASNASFQYADLQEANLRYAQLVESDIRDANLSSAGMFGVNFDNCQLDDVNWGKKYVIVHEAENNWDEAWSVYRTLTRIHEQARLEDIAGEFRFRRERAYTEVIKGRIWGVQEAAEHGKLGQWLSVLSKLPKRRTGHWIYRKASEWLFGYGERPWRVLGAIALMVLMFSFAYFEYSDFQWSRAGWEEFGRRALRALYFSAVSTTALGYGSWLGNEIEPREYVGAIQSFVGIFLNALFLITFTRRWMR